MAYLDNFHVLVGETIMECQRIEHDVKLIYAGMLKGDQNANLELVRNEALGPVLKMLEELDACDGHPYFSASDYKLLNEIRSVRNWLVHKAYSDFMYEDGGMWERSLNKSYAKLRDFNARMNALGDEVERVRSDVLKRYGRI